MHLLAEYDMYLLAEYGMHLLAECTEEFCYRMHWQFILGRECDIRKVVAVADIICVC